MRLPSDGSPERTTTSLLEAQRNPGKESVSFPISFPVSDLWWEKAGRSCRICDYLFETLKSLRFSHAAFDFVYSPCVLVAFAASTHRNAFDTTPMSAFPLKPDHSRA